MDLHGGLAAWAEDACTGPYSVLLRRGCLNLVSDNLGGDVMNLDLGSKVPSCSGGEQNLEQESETD